MRPRLPLGHSASSRRMNILRVIRKILAYPNHQIKNIPTGKTGKTSWEGNLSTPLTKKPLLPSSNSGSMLTNDYLTRFSEDPTLPKRPEIFYQRAWPKTGWRAFLFGAFYPTMRAAAAAARGLGIISITDYGRLRHGDPKLPGAPHEVYKDYTSWAEFILPEKCSTLEETKFAVKYILAAKTAKSIEKNNRNTHASLRIPIGVSLMTR